MYHKIVPVFLEEVLKLKCGQVVQDEKIFKFHECIFAILLLSPFGKRHAPSI